MESSSSERTDGRTPASAPAAEETEAFPALETRARDAGADVADDPVAAAEVLLRLERDVRRFGRDADIRGISGDGAPAGLSDLCRWRSRLGRLGLDAECERAADLVEAYLRDEEEAWRAEAAEAARDGDPTTSFDALRDATDLDREAIRRRGTAGASLLREDRQALRDAFVESLQSRPATERQRDRWATALLDRADVALTAIDDLDPPAASVELGLVADDLAWYVGHIETTRGPRRRRLRRKHRRLIAETQERDLHARLEAMFGRRAVGRFERLILALIFLVLGLLFIEVVVPLSPTVLVAFAAADTLSCLVFLWDFFFRLAIVRPPKWRWFLRHALVDLVPSLPVGVFALGAHGADPLRAGRAIRLLRLTRVARYVRVLMPVIRGVRAFGFLTRGSDRMVRRYGHLLNRDIILYPTREEALRSRTREDGPRRRFHRLEAEVNDLWEDLLVSAEPARRRVIAARRLDAFEQMREETRAARRPSRSAPPADDAREITAETLVHRLDLATPEGIEAEQGSEFTSRIARAVRIFSRGPLRWLPVIGRYVPPLGPRTSDGEVAAAAAHHVAGRIREQLDRWYFFGDLYGTITPAEFVDRVGATLVKGAFRPAYRLVLFGAGLLVVELFLSIAPSAFLRGASAWLGHLVDPFLLLGAVAVFVLALGWWMQRVAGEATSFLEQTAAAQFLPLMESVKGRYLSRDAGILCRRILAPETCLEGKDPIAEEHGLHRRFRRQVTEWLLEAQTSSPAHGSFDALERTVLLYRDGMDGALFDATDTRTTNQLLGNPALRALYRDAGCVTPRERKALKALDLQSHRRAFGGPYLWFSLMTRSSMHATARLIVEYNRHAIPLAELPSASPQARARRDAWLGLSRRTLPPEEAKRAALDHVTTAFTALHFLDEDPRRDRDVEARFGPDVLARLRRDRRAMFRRIFGTYPLHTRPHEQRVVNLYRLYEAWFAGGRALLIPFRALWGLLCWIRRIVLWVVRAVNEIRNPRLREDSTKEAEADFRTAVRKIDRMRGPVVKQSLWLRSRVDCEYLGVRVPGTGRSAIEGHGVRHDLDFLDADPDLRRRVDEERDHAQADIRELAERIEDGLLRRAAVRLGTHPDAFGPEHRRALAFVWRSDMNGVRSLLAARTVLQETALTAASQAMPPIQGLPRPHLWWTFRRWWRNHGRGGRPERRATWRAIRADYDGAGRAMEVLGDYTPEEARAEGERRLAELLRHPARLTEQLLTLRIVQVLGLIDVLNYRSHVWRLGHYAEDDDDPGTLLQLTGVGRGPDAG